MSTVDFFRRFPLLGFEEKFERKQEGIFYPRKNADIIKRFGISTGSIVC